MFINFSSNKNYETIVRSHIFITNCAPCNCSDLFTCKNCSIQYFKETQQALRNHVSLHRSFIHNFQKLVKFLVIVAKKQYATQLTTLLK